MNIVVICLLVIIAAAVVPTSVVAVFLMFRLHGVDLAAMAFDMRMVWGKKLEAHHRPRGY